MPNSFTGQGIKKGWGRTQTNKKNPKTFKHIIKLQKEKDFKRVYSPKHTKNKWTILFYSYAECIDLTTQENPPQYYVLRIQVTLKDYIFYQLQRNLFIP